MSVFKDDQTTYTGNMDVIGSLNVHGDLTVGGSDWSSSWTAYTPIITAGIGTFTTVGASGAYKAIGKIVFVRMTIIITTNGTASAYVLATIPITGITNAVLVGREAGLTGKMLQARIGAVTFDDAPIVNYDNTYPGGNGAVLFMNGVYESV